MRWILLNIAALIGMPSLWIAAVYLTTTEQRLRALERKRR